LIDYGVQLEYERLITRVE